MCIRDRSLCLQELREPFRTSFVQLPSASPTGDWGKLWKAVKDRRKHQSFWDEDAEKRLQFSASGMVRFAKGKTVKPWVAANASDLPPDYTPTEDHKRLAIIDTFLSGTSQGEELFEDLKSSCAMIWGYEGPVDELMDAFANEKDEDIVMEGHELVDTPPDKRADAIRRARQVCNARLSLIHI